LLYCKGNLRFPLPLSYGPKRVSAPHRSGRTETWLKTSALKRTSTEFAGVLREPGRPAVAYLVTPDEERRCVGGAFVTMNMEIRKVALPARVALTMVDHEHCDDGSIAFRVLRAAATTGQTIG
jgi:hypothetical protein